MKWPAFVAPLVMLCFNGCYIPVPEHPCSHEVSYQPDFDPRTVVGSVSSWRPIRPGVSRQRVIDVLGGNFKETPDWRTLVYQRSMCRGIDLRPPYMLLGPGYWRMYYLKFDFDESGHLEHAEVRRDATFQFAGKGMCIRPDDARNENPQTAFAGDERVIEVSANPERHP